VEYPIGTLPVFVAPALISREVGAYRIAFWLLMLGSLFGLLVLLARWIDQREGPSVVAPRLVWYTLAMLGLGPLFLSRFDLVPTLMVFGAACAWETRRSLTAGALLGLGGLVKVFPLMALVPAVADSTRAPRDRLRAILACLGLVGLGTVLWWMIGGQGILASIRYHTERGLELGSTWAGLTSLLAKLFGWPIGFDYEHSSAELVAPGLEWINRLAFPALLLALGAVAWFSRRGRDPMRWWAASLLAFAISGKVLSPQYLIWPLPFIAAIEGRVGRWSRGLFLAACWVTAIVYPWGFGGLAKFHPAMIVVVNVRNALLLATFLVLLLGPDSSLRQRPGDDD
jgi:hypothetical protein